MRLLLTTFKVAATITEPVGEGSVLRANLDEMERRGIRVRTIEGALPAPPGRPDGRTIGVVTPLEINSSGRNNPRYTLAAHGSARILDGDEERVPWDREQEHQNPDRLHQQVRLNIELDEGTEIHAPVGSRRRRVPGGDVPRRQVGEGGARSNQAPVPEHGIRIGLMARGGECGGVRFRIEQDHLQ